MSWLNPFWWARRIDALHIELADTTAALADARAEASNLRCAVGAVLALPPLSMINQASSTGLQCVDEQIRSLLMGEISVREFQKVVDAVLAGLGPGGDEYC